MSLKSLVRALAPIITKKDLMMNISKTREMLKDHAIPAYKNSAATTSGKPLNSKFAKVVNDRFNDFKHLNSPNKNFIEKTLDALMVIEKNQEFILARSEATFRDNIATEAMRYKEVSLINYQASLNNVVEYSMRLINLFWIAEINTIKNKPQFDGVVKGEHDFVEQGLSTFLGEVNMLNMKRDELEKTLDKITDSIFDPDDEETTRSLLSNDKIDPMGFGFIAPRFNPFYLVGRLFVERQDKIYRATEMDLRRVEIRVKAYEEIQRNSPNPTTERALAALDDLRADLQLKLNKMEQ